MSHQTSDQMREFLTDRLLATPPLSPTSSTDDIRSQFDDAQLPASPAPQTPEGERERITLNVDVEVKRSGSGKYMLRVDDELRKLLGTVVAERDGAQGKKRRKKFGDLVFVPRYTAFDRSSDQPKSPYHGFFVLIW